jgi:LuxR family maltose regulon positive regulatory protein
MSLSILATKLYVPPLRRKAVLRARLIERLNEGLGRRLTLISAPPGFGKTTLAAEWVAGCGRPVAWLSLDERDSDPIRFLTYLVAALQGSREQGDARAVAPDLGQGVLAALQSPQPPPAETILTVFLTEIAFGEIDKQNRTDQK